MENNNENRNYMCDCGCDNNMNIDCNVVPEGINAAFGYNSATMMDNCGCHHAHHMDECDSDRNEIREKMIRKIKELNFAIIELSQYLDTHPNDRKALCLHREYANELNELKDKYQRIFGPLTIYFPCNKWRWLESPWPWERSDF